MGWLSWDDGTVGSAALHTDRLETLPGMTTYPMLPPAPGSRTLSRSPAVFRRVFGIQSGRYSSQAALAALYSKLSPYGYLIYKWYFSITYFYIFLVNSTANLEQGELNTDFTYHLEL